MCLLSAKIRMMKPIASCEMTENYSKFPLQFRHHFDGHIFKFRYLFYASLLHLSDCWFASLISTTPISWRAKPLAFAHFSMQTFSFSPSIKRLGIFVSFILRFISNSPEVRWRFHDDWISNILIHVNYCNFMCHTSAIMEMYECHAIFFDAKMWNSPLRFICDCTLSMSRECTAFECNNKNRSPSHIRAN